MKWFDQIDLSSLDNNSGTADSKFQLETLVKLNQALKAYEIAYAASQQTKEHLKNIIELADYYLQSIPPNLRVRNLQTQRFSDELEKRWPHVIHVYGVVKQAVRHIYYSEKTSDSKARWMILASLFELNESAKKIKILEPQYWLEWMYEGNITLSKWLTGDSFYEENIIPFNELKIVEYVEYQLSKTDHQVTFKDGLAYFKGKLLDTSGATGYNTSNGECLYVCDRDGNLFVSNPYEHLPKEFHHSIFLKGKAVLCAGTLSAKDGEFTQIITALSGHYKPRRKHLIKLLEILSKKHGVDISKTDALENNHAYKKPALVYLKNRGFCLVRPKRMTFYHEALFQMSLLNKATVEFSNLQKKTHNQDEQAIIKKKADLFENSTYKKVFFNLEKVSTIKYDLVVTKLNKILERINDRLQPLDKSEKSTLDELFKEIEETLVKLKKLLKEQQNNPEYKELLSQIEKELNQKENLTETKSISSRLIESLMKIKDALISHPIRSPDLDEVLYKQAILSIEKNNPNNDEPVYPYQLSYKNAVELLTKLSKGHTIWAGSAKAQLLKLKQPELLAYKDEKPSDFVTACFKKVIAEKTNVFKSILKFIDSHGFNDLAEFIKLCKDKKNLRIKRNLMSTLSSDDVKETDDNQLTKLVDLTFTHWQFICYNIQMRAYRLLCQKVETENGFKITVSDENEWREIWNLSKEYQFDSPYLAKWDALIAQGAIRLESAEISIGM